MILFPSDIEKSFSRNIPNINLACARLCQIFVNNLISKNNLKVVSYMRFLNLSSVIFLVLNVFYRIYNNKNNNNKINHNNRSNINKFNILLYSVPVNIIALFFYSSLLANDDIKSCLFYILGKHLSKYWASRINLLNIFIL